jgi:MYXO-CTERM domain-containing protein
MQKVFLVLRTSALALALLLGLLTAGPVLAQDATQTPSNAAQTADDEDEGGFDDWGLLGLLGLAGLAGLRRREPEVRRVERTVDRTNDPLR